MIEAVVFSVVLLIVIPVGFLGSMVFVAALYGQLLKTKAEKIDPDSELIATNI